MSKNIGDIMRLLHELKTQKKAVEYFLIYINEAKYVLLYSVINRNQSRSAFDTFPFKVNAISGGN